MKRQPIEGFLNLASRKKLKLRIVKEYLDSNPYFTNILQQYWNDNSELQKTPRRNFQKIQFLIFQC